MRVYMIMNTVTEMAYVGQTGKKVSQRYSRHWDDAKKGSLSPLHVAMREWPDASMWEAVTLETCETQDDLDAAEKRWQSTCNTCDPGVGYNSRMEWGVREDDVSHRGIRETHFVDDLVGGVDVRPPRGKEFYRECGKLGASHGIKGAFMGDRTIRTVRRKADMTPEEIEQYREWGRRGATAAHG